MTKIRVTSLALASAIALVAGMAQAQVELSLLTDTTPENITAAEALVAAYEAANPGVNIEIDTRAGGSEGDNLVKTRLATGEMADIFFYNSGSLFKALNPEKTMADLSDLPNQANVVDSFKTVVTGTDGKVYGVPSGPAMGGGIFYNRKIYADLGLSVPKTWAEFMANGEKIKAAGKVAVVQTYKDTWTSQLFVLSDNFNTMAEMPDWPTLYTENKAKYATTPAALKAFQRLQDVHDAGFLNEDFGAATFDDGMRMVVTGEAAHYPMLTFAVSGAVTNFPDQIGDLGFFAQPGDDAAKNGLTVWMPAAYYVSAASANVEEAKKFVNFTASPEACPIYLATTGLSGPYLLKGCDLPAEVPQAVADMMPYFQTDGMTAPALEFLSPVKGPALEQITVEVGSGIRPAAEAAALYDQDVEKQAKQLGLPNW
jgi:raffinose/stachyose/melibiose transport system substrate-binding protein